MEELGAHPHIQSLLRDEVTKDIPWDYSFKDLDQLPLLNAIIYEALRLYPPLGHMSNRIATVPYVLGDDIAVPPGMMLGWHSYGVQTDPQVWGDDARKFNPSRWGTDSASVKQTLRQRQARGQYLPFGIYGRKCLGYNIAMQMLQCALVELVRNIEWRHPNGYTFSYGRVRLYNAGFASLLIVLLGCLGHARQYHNGNCREAKQCREIGAERIRLGPTVMGFRRHCGCSTNMRIRINLRNN